MVSQLRAAAVLFLLLSMLTGLVYPAVVTVIGQLCFSHRANGSLLECDGKVLGSDLIGQSFHTDRYFWGRPSPTESRPYNAAASSGSNLAPTNPAQRTKVRERVTALRAAHPEQTGLIPVDLVTASGSGLDPHISPAAAEFQAERVARARGTQLEQVRELIALHTERRTFGVLGEPRVNVLRLNLALDDLKIERAR